MLAKVFNIILFCRLESSTGIFDRQAGQQVSSAGRQGGWYLLWQADQLGWLNGNI